MRFNLCSAAIATVCVAAAGCARSARMSASPGELPVCSGEMIAVAPSESSSFAEALAALRQTGWVSATTTVVEATSKAEVSNGARVGRALVASYPLHLRNRGLGGEAIILMLVDEAGKVRRTLLFKQSGYPELDEGAQYVARRMEFHPATFEGCRVASVLALPIVYRSEGLR